MFHEMISEKSFKFCNMLNPFPRYTPCAGANTNRPSHNNISKTVKVNIAFTRTCSKGI